MNGRKKASQPESSSTETPRELETPQEIESWADDIAPRLDRVQAPHAPIEAEAPPPPEPPQRTVSLVSPLDVPQITVVEDGKEVVRPDVIQAVVQLASLGQLVQIRKSLQKEEFKGLLDIRTLDATEEFKFIDLVNDYPHTPWITAYFFNEGPHSARISVNGEDDWQTLAMGASQSLNFAKAERRIEQVCYQCAAGETASVGVTGKY